MAIYNLDQLQHHILLCNGGTCMRNDGEEVTQAVRDEIAKQQAGGFIHTTRTKCNGRCDDGCVTIVYPQGDWYGKMTPESGRELVQALCKGDKLDGHLITNVANTPAN
ncbi:(2Fe-2S) ferredoxin [Paenibacillus sp. 4624]|uniref:(2Fe-2S) ferredoxin domain-containing protein n=1 Tax=Paenibacillus amylolyticus TaxID=1451 RepID=A0A5M9WZ79_PAEAM|nr:(2Fe-2S) ferredoxin domain-containing protein [Paenibacillus amylolyticus]KAA8786980.1 (2Fe-2S) ferredoxin domain-containing protein [Paenibacillus amylolyticus]